MLQPATIIARKRDQEELTPEEIRFFIGGLKTGEVTDYQATALLMAIYLNGMSLNETVALTQAMLDSGKKYDLSKIPGPKVDKHSTGGIGDKVSLILAPLAAACGLKVPMMSGRALGHTGGTLDKLESISGFKVKFSDSEFESMLKDVGCVMIGQSTDIAPADKKLYALRDVTGTVESIELIVASILSKKAAEGTEGLLLDVKVGSGAFMKNLGTAKKLATTLVRVGKKMGMKCRATLTDMNQPLGYTVGNALEVCESIEVLRNIKHDSADGFSSSDLKEITLHLCAHMLVLGKVVSNLAAGRKLARDRLIDGSAWKIFCKMVAVQGGSLAQIENPAKLPQADQIVEWKSPSTGYLAQIDGVEIGRMLIEMGGGRKQASDSVDPSVGFSFKKKLGAKVTAGETLVRVHASRNSDLASLENHFMNSIKISKTRQSVPKLIVNACIE